MPWVDLIFILHKIHYRLLNRPGNFILLGLVVYVLVWSVWFIKPLYSAEGELEEYYGKITRIKSVPLINRYSVRLHDERQVFEFFLDPINTQVFRLNIRQDSHYRIIGWRINKTDFLGIHIENNDFQLNSQALIKYHDQVKSILLLCWTMGLFVIAHILYMEKRYYSSRAQ